MLEFDNASRYTLPHTHPVGNNPLSWLAHVVMKVAEVTVRLT